MSHHKGPQTEMFPAYTRHRKDDPKTSREAAAKAVKTLTEKQRKVLDAFEKYDVLRPGRGLTDYELNQLMRSYSSTWRTRRSELVSTGNSPAGYSYSLAKLVKSKVLRHGKHQGTYEVVR